MMPTAFDYIVVGLGATGSASLYQLARRRAKVLGIDMFHPPHENGSSHGESRITRVSLGEGGHYVPLVRRSHEIWRELEAATGENLLFQCGGLIFGSTRSTNAAHGIEDFLQSTIDVARTHAVGHEILDAAELGRRFPQFKFDIDDIGYYEPEAGFLKPEGCLRAQLSEAQRMGATISTGNRVKAWHQHSGMVRLETDRGDYEAKQVLFAAGPWVSELVSQLSPYARAYRQVLYWFEQEGNAATFSPDNMPVYIRLPDAENEMFYGFPLIGSQSSGLKIAGEQFDLACNPGELERKVSETEIAAMFAKAAPKLRIRNQCLRAVTCQYTVTPDYQFLVDRLPGSDSVWVASPCSGHGFKHSAAVGEAVAELMMSGVTSYDMGQFGWRFPH